MLFASTTDEYRFVIRFHPKLAPGQKKQCFRFLEYWDGMEICERYIQIVTGEIEVISKKNKTYIPFWKKIAKMLTINPGLTRQELAKRLEVHHTSINNSIGKGMRRGIFWQRGERVYVRENAHGFN